MPTKPYVPQGTYNPRFHNFSDKQLEAHILFLREHNLQGEELSAAENELEYRQKHS